MLVAYCLDLGSTVCCEVEGLMFEFEPAEPLSKLLRHLGQDARCFADEQRSRQLQPSTSVKRALSPGRVLVAAPHRHYLLKPYGSGKAVDEWLASLGMDHHRAAFERSGVDDFLVLPYLRPNILEDIGVASANDRNAIMRAVKRLQDLNEFQFVGLWLRYLGLGVYEEAFMKHRVGLRTIAVLRESDFVHMGLNPTRTAHFFHATKYYREFSSAEATFAWLQWSGLERYAYQFARYEVPFYALPLVNFFIIDEMGVTNQDKELLSALQSLEFSPSYAVKAMAYWLRDLELDEYALVFSKNLMVDFIESLTILNDHTINRLIDCNAAREKMKIAVREMKEVQFYYSASESLLQDLVLQKYADVFAKHNISIDSLPLLDDSGLLEMGFTDEADRSAILAAVKKIKAELPSGALRLFYSNEPNLYQIDHKETPMHHSSVSRPKLGERGHPSSVDGHRPEDTRSVAELLSFINGADLPLAASKHFGPSTHSAGTNAFTRSPLHSFPSSPLFGMAGSSAASTFSSSSFNYSPPSSSSLSATEHSACCTTTSARAAKKARHRARRKAVAATRLPRAAAAPPHCAPPPPTAATGEAKPAQKAKAEATTMGNAGKPPPTQPAMIDEAPLPLKKASSKKSPKTKPPPPPPTTAAKKNKQSATSKSTTAPSTTARAAPSTKKRNKTSKAVDVVVAEVLDPALEEQLDREVEEFRQRLELHSAALDVVQRRPVRAAPYHFNPHQLNIKTSAE